ncbi:MAG: terminase large subunit [Mycoplasmataceae bacterium]|jgi:phage terminase large subunit-like protein|nr:terminase large subunit [Mycoplasmataceae bacterium]
MESYYKEVKKYCNDIIKNKIQSGTYCKKAVKRFLNDINRSNDEDFLYELIPERADKVIRFAEKLYIPDINKNLELLPWMKFVYYNLFGFVHKADNSRRRFRSGYIEVARKNSKTTSLLFPIILYDFFTEPSAESYFVAKDGAQSEKSFKELKQIIKKTDWLKDKTNENISTITYEGSRIAFFSSESEGIDSYKNSISVIDEYHAYDNDKIITAFKYGSRTRKNGLVLIITSAGLDISGPCYIENEKSKKILNGILTDETYFTIIYSYDDKDKWSDPSLFIKANPSLGPILKQDILENDLTDALITPSHQADFKSKTCGIWSSGTSSWIPLQKWEDGQPSTINFDDFKEQSCYGSLDLSSVGDWTAYTLCFNKDEEYYFKHKFYVPEEKIQERYKKENIGILEWIQKGLVKSIPGDTIDYSYILEDIKKDYELFNIREIAYDSWGSRELINSIEKEMPRIVLIPYSQSLKGIGPATKNYEKLVLEHKIKDSNPIIKWMLGNVQIKPDVNQNYKPLKDYKSSTKRIDGIITSIMALDRTIANKDTNTNKDFNSILNLFQ